MADTMYAWSPILYGAEVDPDTGVMGKAERIEMGETVSASDLDIEDADFDALVESGAVRPYAPPELPENFQGSVVDHLKDEARKAMGEDADVAFSLGGSYFGPTPEEAAMNPESVGVEAKEEEAPKPAATKATAKKE